jgi:HEPN domain-containing protein
MTDILKQTHYWLNQSDSDLETAQLLLNNSRILHSLFSCHLAIEKAIKAKVVVSTNDFAPKSHNLFYLTEKAKLTLPDEYEALCGTLMKYQLEGRYPDFEPEVPAELKAADIFAKTSEFQEWLKIK